MIAAIGHGSGCVPIKLSLPNRWWSGFGFVCLPLLWNYSFFSSLEVCVDSLFVMKYKKKDRILLSPPCNHKAYNFKVVQFVPSLNFPTFLGRNRNTHQNVNRVMYWMVINTSWKNELLNYWDQMLTQWLKF